MFKRFSDTMGEGRMQALFIIIGTTGLLSLLLNAVKAAEWVQPAQNLLAAVGIFGVLFVILSALGPADRGRWIALGVPAAGAVALGLTVLPQYLLPLVGGAIGWIVAGLVSSRANMPDEYKAAIKHLRKNEYPDAVKAMDEVIKEQPDKAQHYRFRAEVLRVWGKLDRARRDYQEMIRLDPESAVAHNGLAEVELQSRRYDAARDAALKAYALAPNEWVAVYNLAMIEDRLEQSERVVEHAENALALKVPDARHRVLLLVYLMRAYSRLGKVNQADAALKRLQKEQAGLKEWQTILESDQAATLREAIGGDVEVARSLVDGTLTVQSLAKG